MDNQAKKLKKTGSEEVSMLASALILSDAPAPLSMAAMRPGESQDQAQARAAAIRARIAAQS